MPYTSPMNNLSLSSRVKLSENILFREMQGEAVLLNIETGIYFGLDSTGTATWNVMQKQKNVGKIIDSLLQEYEIDPETCREDLLKFLNNLQKNGLLEVHEA